MERGLGGVSKVTQSYFRKALGVILMYDSNHRETLVDLATWVKTCRKNSAWHPCDSHVTFALWRNQRSNYGVSGVSENDPENIMNMCNLQDIQHFCISTSSGCGILSSYCNLVNNVHEKARDRENLGCSSPCSPPCSTAVLEDHSSQAEATGCLC